MSTFGIFLATGGTSTTAGGAPVCSLMVFSAPAYHRTFASDGGGPSPATSCGSHATGRSPRTAGPQPRDVLRLALHRTSPRTAGAQPRDVLRLTRHRTLASDGGGPSPATSCGSHFTGP